MSIATSLRPRATGFTDARTYIASALFVLGNIALPRLIHFIPQGGPVWLPIYFFTLIGAWLFGWRAGIITALLSPVVNSLLFGMPAAAMLPVITAKSVLLALAAGWLSARPGRLSLLVRIICAIAIYQGAGTLVEWALTGSLAAALGDLTLGLPGLLLQICGGYAVIRCLTAR